MAASRRIEFLASVRSEGEAQIALAGGADVIDCKEPSSGALGACTPAVVAAVRRAMPARVRVSATIGDLPCRAADLLAGTRAMAATGVDYVKIGLFPGGEPAHAVAALGESARASRGQLGRARLVAVLFADLQPEFAIIPALARAGFAGVMLDTAGKGKTTLVDFLTQAELRRFITEAHSCGLFAGLAGSLRLEHIPQLAALQPDLLGFRGALCRGHARQGELNAEAVRVAARAVREPRVLRPRGDEALAS
jgi:uncharacterized protein (UPF0264 family)